MQHWAVSIMYYVQYVVTEVCNNINMTDVQQCISIDDVVSNSCVLWICIAWLCASDVRGL